MPLRKAPTARRAVLQQRRAVLQHTTAALLAATATSASANIGGADYVIGGARLSEAITNPEGQVEARLPRDQAEALARAATDYGSIGEAFAADDGAAAQQIHRRLRDMNDLPRRQQKRRRARALQALSLIHI